MPNSLWARSDRRSDEELACHLHTGNVPIVVVTGTDKNLDGANVDHILRKPVPPEIITRAVNNALTERRLVSL